MLERQDLPLIELIKQYPLLEEWFANPLNISAQLQGDRRLLSAREKLTLFGGREQIRENLAVLERNGQNPNLYIILLACRQEPMVGTEIGIFGDLIGRHLNIITLYGQHIRNLIRSGQLLGIEDLTYITRCRQPKYPPDYFSLTLNRNGFLTTEGGIRQMILSLEDTVLPKLVLAPRPG